MRADAEVETKSPQEFFGRAPAAKPADKAAETGEKLGKFGYTLGDVPSAAPAGGEPSRDESRQAGDGIVANAPLGLESAARRERKKEITAGAKAGVLKEDPAKETEASPPEASRACPGEQRHAHCAP